MPFSWLVVYALVLSVKNVVPLIQIIFDLFANYSDFSNACYQNGAFVEAVIMRYDTRLGKYNGKPRPGGPRSTLCVSSQV